MDWIYENKKHIQKMSSVGDFTKMQVLHLSVNEKNVSSEDKEAGILRFICRYVNDVPSVLQLRDIVLSLQKEYDTCDEVNVFYVNGEKCWFDKATRVGLILSINLEREIGKKETAVWFGGNPVTMRISTAVDFLRELELYAMECYNVTQKHIAEINNTETVEELLDFDITADYPEPVRFEVRNDNLSTQLLP